MSEDRGRRPRPGPHSAIRVAIAALAIVSGITGTFVVGAQTIDIGLVDDINTDLLPLSSFPRMLAQLGDVILFRAEDGIHGTSLWSTDGTEQGTQILAPGTSVPFIHRNGHHVVLDEQAFFFAEDAVHGLELWKSDGSPSGTSIVKDIQLGAASAGAEGYVWREIPYLAIAGGRIFFPAEDGENGVELWTTDGTADGTQLVFDVCPGECGSWPQFLTAVGDLVYFAVVDEDSQGVFGTPKTLWRTDGTSSGTYEILNSAKPRCFFGYDGRLLIGAFTGTTSSESVEELWVSDGTVSGTYSIHAFIDPETSRCPCDFRSIGDVAVFTTSTAATGFEIWRTDGSGPGTQLLKDIAPGPDWSQVEMGLAVNDVLTLTATTDGDGRRLWRTDGTSAGTVPVLDPCPGPSGDIFDLEGVYLDRVLFRARDCEHGIEPWLSDGTAEGSMMLLDVDQGVSGSGLGSGVAVTGGLLYFSTSSNSSGRTLWKTDGSPEGSMSVLSNSSGDSYDILGAVDDGIVFAGHRADEVGRELWKTEGTEQETYLLRDIFPATASSSPSNLVSIGDSIFFVARDGVHGQHLRVTEGNDGSNFVANGWDVENPASLVAVGEEVYFWAQKEHFGPKLWKTDGTGDGTVSVDSLCEDWCDEVNKALAPWQGKFLFSGGRSVDELWISDGTPGGTVVLSENLRFGVQNGSPWYAANVIDMGDYLLFVGVENGSWRDEFLWRTDGTPDGTMRVAAIRPDGGGDPQNFTRVGSLAFFTASNGYNGEELWVTDGTTSGTRMVKDIRTGVDSSRPDELTAHRDKLYFRPLDSLPGGWIWVSDGTEEGTLPLVEAGEHPDRFVSFGNELYFVDGTTWEQWLWRTDGTQNGTVKVLELDKSPTVRAPMLGVLGNSLFVVNIDRDYRATVWRVRSHGGAEVIYTDGASWGDLSHWTHLHRSNLVFSATTSILGSELWRIRSVTPAPREVSGRRVAP